MRFFIAPAFPAQWPHQQCYDQQIEENNRLPQHVIHQIQRRQLRHHRPKVQRQQCEANAYNLATPVAGQLRRHTKMAYRHALFFQHLPAQPKDQPEHRELFTKGPEQIADI
ncbi:Uncharacterised protein [Salmonella enterica subsp. enterica serovar Bovismorbificans]|uniref:Uncharacterized protein n=1 Tax=Salmonella enterica subsp. enterica serovar Bovismorbificans TaxID=58097 RepID=A0A655EB59_SALET|nr:Uncharacterised protein [Salmonella enterica subsp. enterica serovar Bovismorbificans]